MIACTHICTGVLLPTYATSTPMMVSYESGRGYCKLVTRLPISEYRSRSDVSAISLLLILCAGDSVPYLLMKERRSQQRGPTRRLYLLVPFVFGEATAVYQETYSRTCHIILWLHIRSPSQTKPFG